MAFKVNNYLKNLGRAVKYATVNYAETEYESLAAGTKQIYKGADTTARAIINYKQTIKRAQDYLLKSTIYEVGKEGIKNIKDDLRTGNFYNQQRSDKLMEKAFADDDDFDLNFDEDFNIDEDNNDSSETDVTNGDIVVAKTVSDSSKSNANQISSTLLTTAEYQADVTKRSSSFLAVQQERLFGTLNNSVNELGNSMRSVSDYMNGTMSTHIQNSTKYFEETTKYQRENNAILKELIEMERVRFKEEEERRKIARKRSETKLKTDITDVLNIDGTLDWENYFGAVKKNLRDEADSLGLGMLADLSKDELMAMVSNPLGALSVSVVSKVIGPNVEKSLQSLNKTFGSIFSQLNAELLAISRNSDGGLPNILANIFGIKTQSKTKINPNNYEKGQVPFDGITRKAIIEVIPGYLARIESALTKNSNERYFDYHLGQWTSIDEIQKNRDRNRINDINYGTSSIRNKAKDVLKRLNLNKDSQSEAESILDELLEKIYENDGSLYDLSEDFNEGNRKKIFDLIKNMDRRGLAADIADKKRNRANITLRNEIQGDSIDSILVNKSLRNKPIISGGLYDSDEYNGKTNSILENMLNELYLIRSQQSLTTSVASGYDISLPIIGSTPDYIKDYRIKREIQERVRLQKSQEDRKKSESYRQIVDNGKSLSDISELDISEVSKNFRKENKTSDFDNILNADGVKGKYKEFKSSIWDVIRKPRKFVAASIDYIDQHLYDFFFTHPDKDEDGKEIHGFFDKVSNQLKRTFNDVRDYIKEAALNPLKSKLKEGWNFIKEFVDGTGAGEFFKKAFNSAKEDASSMYNSAKDALFKKKTKDISADNNIVSKLGDSFSKGSLVNDKNITTVGNSIRDPKSSVLSSTSLFKNLSSSIKRNNTNLFVPKVEDNADGSLFVPNYGLTTISKGELILPADMNPFNPNRKSADRDKDRKIESQIKDKFITGSLMDHADGGNKLDNNDSIEEVTESLSDKIVGKIKSTFSTENLSKGRQYGQKTGSYISSSFSKGLDYMSNYATENFSGDMAKSMQSDISKLRKDPAGVVGRTGLAAGIGAIFGPGGLMAGAMLGAGINLIRESETFKNVMFGKKLNDGSREGGILSRGLQAKLKKSLPQMGIGSLAMMLVDPFGLGMLGNITLGSGMGLISTSKSFQEFMYGRAMHDKDGKVIGHRGGLLNTKLIKHIKKSLPQMGAGSLAMLLTDPFGLGFVGNMAFGSGMGLLSTSETFQNFILGKKDRNGKRNGGLKGALSKHFIDPLVKFGTTLKQDFFGYLNNALFSPLANAFGVLKAEFKIGARELKNSFKNFIEKTIAGPMTMLLGKGITQFILHPLGTITKGLGWGVGKFTRGVGSILALPGKGLNLLANRERRRLIGRGEAVGMSAKERLDMMGDKDYRSRDRDLFLENASDDQLLKLREAVEAIQDSKAIKTSYDKAVQGTMKKASDHLGWFESRNLGKLIRDGKIEEAYRYVNSLDIEPEKKRELDSILKKGIDEIERHRGRTQQTKAKMQEMSELANRFGFEIDMNNRSSIDKSLDVINTQIKHNEDNKTLASVSTDEEVQKISDGMSPTNEILNKILNVLEESRNIQAGGRDNLYFDEEKQNRLSTSSGTVERTISRDNERMYNTFNRSLGINLVGKTNDTSFIMGRENDKKRNYLSMVNSGLTVNLDVVSKLDEVSLKRYVELINIVGDKDIKSINPKDLSEKNLTDNSFKVIKKIFSLRKNGRGITFKGNLSELIRMKDSQIKILGELIDAGMSGSYGYGDLMYAIDNKAAYSRKFGSKGTNILLGDAIASSDNMLFKTKSEGISHYENSMKQQKAAVNQAKIDVKLNRKDREEFLKKNSTYLEVLNSANTSLEGAESKLAAAATMQDGVAKDEALRAAQEELDKAREHQRACEKQYMDNKQRLDSVEKSINENTAKIAAAKEEFARSLKAKKSFESRGMVDKEGRQLIRTTDGSLTLAKTESNDDINEEIEKNKKDEQGKQQDSLFGKIKNFFSGKDKEGKKEKKKSWLSELVDGFMDKAMGILGTGALLTFLAPHIGTILETVGPIIKDAVVQVLPAIGEFAYNSLQKVGEGVLEMVKQIPGILWEGIKGIPGMLWEAIKSLLPGGGGRKPGDPPPPGEDNGNGGLKGFGFATLGAGGLLGGLYALRHPLRTVKTLGKGLLKLPKGIYNTFKFGKDIATGNKTVGGSLKNAGKAVKNKTLNVMGFGNAAEEAAEAVTNVTKRTPRQIDNVTDYFDNFYKNNGKAANIVEEAAMPAAESVAKSGGWASKLFGGKYGNLKKAGLASAAIAGLYGAANSAFASSPNNTAMQTAGYPQEFTPEEFDYTTGQKGQNNNLLGANNTLNNEEVPDYDEGYTNNLRDSAFAVSSVYSGAKAIVGAQANKVAENASWISKFINKGLQFLAKHIPFLAKSSNLIVNLGEKITRAIMNPKVFTKISGKVAAATGITIATGGIGGIIMAAFKGLDFAASVANGYRIWYNIAGVLKTEDNIDDNTKWMCALANGLDALCWDVLGASFFANILFDFFGVDLTAKKMAANKAVDDYNNNPKSHKPGQPTKCESIQQYNDEVLGSGSTDRKSDEFGAGKEMYDTAVNNTVKDDPGSKVNNLWDSSSKSFRPIGAERPSAIKEAYERSKNYMSDVATSTWNTVKRGTSWVADKASAAWDTVKSGASWVGDKVSDAWDWTKKKFGFGAGKDGKFFRQTDPRYADMSFNIHGDTIKQTIGDSACGPVAGANALRALGASSINPVEASKFALDNGYKKNDTGVSPDFFKSYANSHSATAKSVGAEGTVSELSKGNPVVLEGKSNDSTNTPFGSYPHYVTATGVDLKKNTIDIQDPESKSDETKKYNIDDVLGSTITANSFTRLEQKYIGKLYKGKFGTRGLPDKKVFGLGRLYGRGEQADVNGDIPSLVWDRLSEKGLGDAQIAGILGNMYAESRFDPAVINPDGGAMGLIQWKGERRTALENFAAENGGDPSDPEIQIGYLLKEISSGYEYDQLTDGNFWNLTDPEEAADVFVHKFERGSDAEIAQSIDLRKQVARDAFASKGRGIKNTYKGGGGSGKVAQNKPKYSGILGKFMKMFDEFKKPFDGMMNSFMSSISSPMDQVSKILGIDSLGGSAGGDASSTGGGTSPTPGNLKGASAWAESVIDQVQSVENPPYWYGPNGCTAFVNEYLRQAGADPIAMYVPTAMEEAKRDGTFKGPNEPAVEGDVGLINVNSDPEPDHVVIEDGQGGFWSNLSGGHKIGHGSHSDYFQDIMGYISRGGGGNGIVNKGGSATSEDMTDAGPTATGKHGLNTNEKLETDWTENNESLLETGGGLYDNSIDSDFGTGDEPLKNKPLNVSKPKRSERTNIKTVYGAGPLDGQQSTSTDYASTVIALLSSIDAQLKIIAGNTNGISGINENQSNMQNQVSAVTSNFETLGKSLLALKDNFTGQLSQIKNGLDTTLNKIETTASPKSMLEVQRLAAK